MLGWTHTLAYYGAGVPRLNTWLSIRNTMCMLTYTWYHTFMLASFIISPTEVSFYTCVVACCISTVGLCCVHKDNFLPVKVSQLRFIDHQNNTINYTRWYRMYGSIVVMLTL